MNFSDIISSGAQAEARPVLQLRAKSGSAFIVLAGNKEKSQAEKCGFNITYRYTVHVLLELLQLTWIDWFFRTEW